MAIFTKLGVKDIDSNFAIVIRTSIVLPFWWWFMAVKLHVENAAIAWYLSMVAFVLGISLILGNLN